MAIIDKPSDYFNTKLYTGNGGTQSITGVGFQPDWVWIKERNNAASHKLYDIVRGATEVLESDGSYGEGTDVNGLTAFDSDGFSLGSSISNNGSGDTYASWNWLAGGTASSNTDGSITSSVSANQDAGFSIVSYTGTGANATVGHGLGSAPAWILFKDRSTTKDWFVYHQSISPATGGKLNLTVNPGADFSYFQNTAPTSSVFSIGSANTVNPSSNEMIAYCFAEKQGYSKFGSYEGNNTTNNAFIYTGFKPAWVMVKNVDASYGWQILDNKRNTYNPADDSLFANLNNAEDVTTGDDIDFLSNGFKVREGGNSVGDNYTYIYMAFAENPFVTSTGVPATAR